MSKIVAPGFFGLWIVFLLVCSTGQANKEENVGKSGAIDGTTNPSQSGQPSTRADNPVSGKVQQLRREGERLSNLTGEFRISGDAVVFYPEESEPMHVLENLALERIVRVLGETRGKREWIITALVTEYKGANYILIQRAVLKARPVKEPAR